MTGARLVRSVRLLICRTLSTECSTEAIRAAMMTPIIEKAASSISSIEKVASSDDSLVKLVNWYIQRAVNGEQCEW